MAELIIYVADLDRMGRFYEGCLGLTAAERADDHVGLRSAEWTVWLVRGNRPAGPSDPGEHEPRRRSETPIKPAFIVPSIAAARAAVTEGGGTIATRTWSFAGYDRADATDPEGNLLQLLQAACDPPAV
jgi:predicted enzyme related to lactoylglutathione lyase